uniref:Uncharacterized protein n=1 Tax=Hemiselmis andersenii TaxID=464988 RepID=A0A6T8P2X0_HEMAN|mmetsp:Transcript_40008/g.92980  ORF Transcript_40008/g.92980 Transcript_40008/m.92980 type:complete len:371 (+) Transcript_40008:41-1153(+)
MSAQKKKAAAAALASNTAPMQSVSRPRPKSAAAAEYERAYQEGKVAFAGDVALSSSTEYRSHSVELQGFAPSAALPFTPSSVRPAVRQSSNRKPGDPITAGEAIEVGPARPLSSVESAAIPAPVHPVQGRMAADPATFNSYTASRASGVVYTGYERMGPLRPVESGSVVSGEGHARWYNDPARYTQEQMYRHHMAQSDYVTTTRVAPHRQPKGHGNLLPTDWNFGIDNFLGSTQGFLKHSPSHGYKSVHTSSAPLRAVPPSQAARERRSIAAGDGAKSWLRTKPLVPVVEGPHKAKGTGAKLETTTADSAMYAAPGFVGIVAVADALVTGKAERWADSLTETFRVPEHFGPPETVTTYDAGGRRLHEVHV